MRPLTRQLAALLLAALAAGAGAAGAGAARALRQECTAPATGDLPTRDSRFFVSEHGKLAVQGTKLVDEKGAPVQLAGTSRSNDPLPACHNKAALEILVSKYGVNLFRVPVIVNDGQPPSAADVQRMEETVAWCEELGVYAIIDWHSLGNPNRYLDGEGGSTGVAITFWDDISRRYAGKKHVLYELAATPSELGWNQLLAYHNSVIAAIRKNDPDTVILASVTNSGLDVEAPANQGGVANPSNVMYSIHAFVGSHAYLRDAVKRSDGKIPLFMTEFGLTSDRLDGDLDLLAAQTFLETLNERSIAWTGWAYGDGALSTFMLKTGACGQASFEDFSCSGRFLADAIVRLEKPKPEAPPGGGNDGDGNGGGNGGDDQPVGGGNQPVGDDGSSSMPVIIGGSVGGLFLVVVVGLLVRHRSSPDVESLRMVPSRHHDDDDDKASSASSRASTELNSTLGRPEGSASEFGSSPSPQALGGAVRPDSRPSGGGRVQTMATAGEPTFAFGRYFSWTSVRSSIRSFM